MRYPDEPRWVAVAVSENRRTAARLAANAYRHLPNDAGRDPMGVRIMATAALEAEGGTAAVTQAATDLWARAEREPRPRDSTDTQAHISTRGQHRTPTV
jgi:hypothetical protein